MAGPPPRTGLPPVCRPNAVQEAGVPECLGQDSELHVVGDLQLEEVGGSPVDGERPEIDLALPARAPAGRLADRAVEDANWELPAEPVDGVDGCERLHDVGLRRERALQRVFALGNFRRRVRLARGASFVDERLLGPDHVEPWRAREPIAEQELELVEEEKRAPHMFARW